MSEQKIADLLKEPVYYIRNTKKHWEYLVFGIILGLFSGYLIFEQTAFAPGDELRLSKNNIETSRVVSRNLNLIQVDNQYPGMSAIVKSISMSRSGWLAIHDNLNGQPGRTLGAIYVGSGDTKDVIIPLLRGTVDGESYMAIIHDDDGDHQFNYKTDLPRTGDNNTPLTAGFKAEAASRVGN